MIRRPPDRSRRSGPSRAGSVMVLVLASMAVAAAIAATMLRSATTARRTLRTERDLRQVECLLAAAADIARAGAIDGPILIESPDLAGSGSARITFARDPAAAVPSIRIVVEYPLEGPLIIRRSRSVMSPTNPSATPEETPP